MLILAGIPRPCPWQVLCFKFKIKFTTNFPPMENFNLAVLSSTPYIKTNNKHEYIKKLNY